MKAFADRFGASCLRVVTRSKVRIIASVGLSSTILFLDFLLEIWMGPSFLLGDVEGVPLHTFGVL
ncbi:MAG: hypothetical protein DMG19_12475 [Acidobacteria bacterium]|nr:MAG: hypothetical protein DMG19_12475 [Acidobacteriota bacterium]